MRGEPRVYPDASALARAAATDLARLAREGVQRTGRFSVVLTGGSSPRELYRLLAEEEFSGTIPWQGVHLFWGDERAVPPGHPRSNFGMARERFVGRVPIPPDNVHRIRGELGAEAAAEAYEAELRSFFGSSPRFDLVHLGLGSDGHVASLFPFDLDALGERERWVRATLRRELGEPRVTLTIPALSAAARVEFLIPGADKAQVARTAMAGALDPLRIPAQLIRPRAGELVVRLTSAAASGFSEIADRPDGASDAFS